jgi:hypothetical protein
MNTSSSGQGHETLVSTVTAPGRWEGSFAIPGDASGTLLLTLTAIDLAANVRGQTVELEVR